MSAASALRWIDVEAVCSWCYAKGKAGEYKITWSFGHPGQTLCYPNGSTAPFPTRDAAKEAAEGFEQGFIANMKPTTDKFWMVYGIGRGEPRYHHYTAESAANEAARLAGVYPEITFVVLEVVDAYRSEKPVINKLDIVLPTEGRDADDDIPF
jgi:hypothetical protein